MDNKRTFVSSRQHVGSELEIKLRNFGSRGNTQWHAVAQSVEAQRYKREDRGFDSRWGSLGFIIGLVLPAALRAWRRHSQLGASTSCSSKGLSRPVQGSRYLYLYLYSDTLRSGKVFEKLKTVNTASNVTVNP